jgi:hypothetical protein
MDLIEGARMGCMEDGVDGAAAVTREARDDMDVQVGNGLAGRAAIVDPNGERRSPKGMSDASRDLLDRLEELPRKFWRQIREPLRVRLGDDERMAIGHRVKIEKRDGLCVLVDLVGG